MLLSGWKCIAGLLQWLNSSWQSPGHTLISLASNSWIWKIYWVWFLCSDMSLTNQQSVHTEEREHSALAHQQADEDSKSETLFTSEYSILPWSSFSWKNFIPGFAGSCNICYIYYYLLTPSPNPQCLASPFKSLSIPSPHLEVYLTINFYLKWSVWHIPHSNPQWPGKRKLESLEN